jgi:hypothetical protein
MQTFKDRFGCEWTIKLTKSNVLTVLKILDRKTFEKLELSAKIHRVANVLYIACREQAVERGISKEDFHQSVETVLVIEDATQALTNALFKFQKRSYGKSL